MEFYDPIESCPYNIMHRIRRSRMQFHITTCAQNHKHVQGMVQCPFDARHVIKRIEFEHHKNTCPARESVLNYADHDTRPQVQLKVLPIDVKPVGKWHEKWDKDADVKTYNPIENIKNKPIVYPLIGVSKSKRKIHRLQERERYNRIKEDSEISISRNSSYSESMNRSSKLNYLAVAYEIGESTNEQGYKPLRAPKKYVADNSIDKIVDKVTNHMTESTKYVARKAEILSSASEIEETSNDSYSSASVSSSNNQKYISSKVPSEDFEIFKKVPREFNVAAANIKNQEKNMIYNKISSISEKDKHQINAYQYEDQQKCSVPDLLSMASSMNGYLFEEYQFDDHEKCSIADAVSTVYSKDQYEFESLQQEQETYTIPDLIVSREDKYQFELYQDNHKVKSLISDKKTYSVVSSKDEYGFEPYQYNEQEDCSVSNVVSSFSKDNYQFEPHQYKDYEKSSIADTVSVISSKGEYGFKPYQYNEQEKCSIPDTFSITSKDNYQFELHEYEDYEKSSISDAISIASTKNNYEFGPHQYRDYEKSPTADTLSIASNKNVHQSEAYKCNDQYPIFDKVNTTFSQDRYFNKGPEKYLSLSVDEISDINSEYNYIEDDTVVLSETIEKSAEKNENKKNYLMTDIVYDVFSDDESPYNMTTVSWNLDVTPTSAENYETASESLSFETAESSFNCDSSTTRKPPQNVGILGKLLQMIKSVTMNDTGHNKKSESLNHVDPDKGKLFPRCGANFLNLQ